MKICITLCTRGRPVMLARCLDSLPPAIEHASRELSVSVVVVENGEKSGAEACVAERRQQLQIDYIFEPAEGIPFARNAGVEAALKRGCDWIIFIDDDEWVAEDWLTRLVEASRIYDADVLNGPVIKEFGETAPDWLPRYRLGSRATGMLLSSAPTNNTMVTSEIFAGSPDREYPGLRFDTRLRLTGGSDSELFQRVRSCDRKIVWVEEAQVFEEYPARRATLGWHMERNIRRASCGVLIERLGGRPQFKYAMRGAINSGIEGIGRIARGTFLLIVDRRKAWRDYGLGVLSLASCYGYLRGLMGIYSAPYSVIDGH
ncbi:glycosyltransferase family 2 protein [Limimaricola litoreus]|uniref:Glycosyltransferase n=1 Tax=Limimaricola litoreus TaxID=2955316 RepID=A0A9X2FQ96_9RHOB|nr:glycosyltransferase family 2 protein [Limimaricola litoreus]MCP1168395.1 glycosyltransferase [Limimaricola litoreus]